MADDHDDIDHHVAIYKRVFGALMVLTVVTVAVSWIDLPVALTIIVALIIALTKSSLVACYFMHLNAEKKMVYWVLLLTLFFFVVLLLIPSLWASDEIRI